MFCFSIRVLIFKFLFMNIYVANISFKADENQLRQIFEEYGQVSSIKIVTDRETGRSRGFGFVEMPNDGEGKQAINALNGKTVYDRQLVVNEARPKSEGGGGKGYGGNRGGFRRDSYNNEY